jgi:hypothetical protein
MFLLISQNGYSTFAGMSAGKAQARPMPRRGVVARRPITASSTGRTSLSTFSCQLRKNPLGLNRPIHNSNQGNERLRILFGSSCLNYRQSGQNSKIGDMYGWATIRPEPRLAAENEQLSSYSNGIRQLA